MIQLPFFFALIETLINIFSIDKASVYLIIKVKLNANFQCCITSLVLRYTYFENVNVLFLLCQFNFSEVFKTYALFKVFECHL